jgi:ribonuclease HI
MTTIEELFMKFCKINNIDEQVAIDFLNEELDEENTGDTPVINEENSAETVVFTDGACTSNGRKNPCGGIGVFYGDSDPRNVSEELMSALKKIFKNINFGKPTNNKAELTAILWALISSITDLNNKKKLKIYSDSRYSIDCLTKWYKAWEKNDWKNSKGSPVLNKEIIQGCLEIIKGRESQISFIHVRSHQTKPPSNNPKYFEWYGNHMADILATKNCT